MMSPAGSTLDPATPPHSEDRDESQRVSLDAAPGAARGLRTTPPERLGDPALVGAGGRPPRGPVLQLDARRTALRGARRVRRRLHQRAPPERLGLHAEPELDGKRARQADE